PAHATDHMYSLSLHDALPNSALRAVSIPHHEDARILMPCRDAGLLLEADAEQPAGHIEAGGDDMVELEIGLQLRLVEGEFLRAKDRKSTRLNSSHVKISYAVF